MAKLKEGGTSPENQPSLESTLHHAIQTAVARTRNMGWGDNISNKEKAYQEHSAFVQAQLKEEYNDIIQLTNNPSEKLGINISTIDFDQQGNSIHTTRISKNVTTRMTNRKKAEIWDQVIQEDIYVSQQINHASGVISHQVVYVQGSDAGIGESGLEANAQINTVSGYEKIYSLLGQKPPRVGKDLWMGGKSTPIRRREPGSLY